MFVRFEDILFVDIETAPQKASLSEMPERLQALWKTRADSARENADVEIDYEADFRSRAALQAEFGRVVCISVGVLSHVTTGDFGITTKSYCQDDEVALLRDFAAVLFNFWGNVKYTRALCGHNIKEFDVPFIVRRMMINRIPVPPMLGVMGKKPWEIPFLDTLELWSMGDYRHKTSLETLTAVFGIDTPKDDINGSQVSEVFYGEHDLERISAYCQKDVLATAQVYLAIMGQPPIVEHGINFKGI